jgi:hypothetical protein
LETDPYPIARRSSKANQPNARFTPTTDEAAAVRAALEQPRGMPRIGEQVRPSSHVLIALDDPTVPSYGSIRQLAVEAVLAECAEPSRLRMPKKGSFFGVSGKRFLKRDVPHSTSFWNSNVAVAVPGRKPRRSRPSIPANGWFFGVTGKTFEIPGEQQV